ncbi:TerD family protein [Clostridioides difficile]|uniref:TerD family protein n=1 Tax=Clostridioides difficile TaxID=1496 RepID=UPI001F1BEB3E
MHTGDNLTGKGEGDDEQIIVNLEDIPEYGVSYTNSTLPKNKKDEDSVGRRLISKK